MNEKMLQYTIGNELARTALAFPTATRSGEEREIVMQTLRQLEKCLIETHGLMLNPTDMLKAIDHCKTILYPARTK